MLRGRTIWKSQYFRKINSEKQNTSYILDKDHFRACSFDSTGMSVFFLRICFVIYRWRLHAKCFMHFPAYECTERIVWRSGSIEVFYWDTVLSYANVKSLGWGMSYANWKAWRDVCKYWQTWYRGRVDTFIRRPKSGRLDELLKGFHGSGEMEVLSTRFSNVTTDRESSYWSILTQDLILFRKRLIWSLSTLANWQEKFLEEFRTNLIR